MRSAVATCLLVGALLAGAGAQGAPSDDRVDERIRAATDAGAALPACIAVASQARYIPFGYNHVVIIGNACTRDAVCIVATDVNPEPIRREVAAQTTAEVLTFMASPSSTFVASVNCKLL